MILYPCSINENITYACGLFAFIGNNPGRYFNWDKFNTLGFFNDDRGGDACGRILNNKVVWGVDKLKKYKDLICEIDNIPSRVKSNTVLGHCRRASSGGRADIYAQPVVLFKSDLDMSKIKDTHMISGLKAMKDDEIVFSGIHNGTIDNYLDLADQYGIDTLNHNDSRVLFTILFYGNYKVLKEYEGTAALIWQNHVLNKTYIFKGESKQWSSSYESSEERPLYAWKIAEDNLYISSIKDSLRFIQNKKDAVNTINSNTLYKFLDGVNYTSEKYDRSQCIQNKVYKNAQVGFNYNNKNVSNLPMRYENDDDYINYREYYEKDTELPWKLDSVSYRVGEKYIRSFSANSDIGFRISSEKSDKFISKTLKKVIYNKSRYWMHGGLMHGVYVLSQGGIVPVNTYAKGIIVLKPYYFIEGILMDGNPAYSAAMKLHTEFMNNVKDPLLDNLKLEEDFTSDIAKYSRFPVTPLLNTSGTELCFSPRNSTLSSSNLYTGKYQALFSDKFYKYDLGELTSIEETRETKMANHDSEDDISTKMYIEDLKGNGYDGSPWCVGGELLKSDTYINPMSPFQSYLIDNCDFYGIIDNESTFIIHYMRDFNEATIRDCLICPNADTSFITTCHRCNKLRGNLNFVKTIKLYGIYG